MISDQNLYQTRLDFVRKLSLLIRTIKIYNPENETLDRHLKECLRLIRAILKEEKRLSLRVLMDAIFVNEERVRISRDTYQSIKLIMDELKDKMVGEVLFSWPVSSEDLKGFLYHLVGSERGDGGDGHPLGTKLIKENIYSITVKLFDPIFIDEKLRKKEAKKIYFRSIAMVKEVCQNLLEHKPMALRKGKRLTQSMVDLLLSDKVPLLGLASIKNYDGYTYNHSVNVSIYSLAVGARLGFPKKILAELGLAALLHDVGKARIPDAILKKPDKLSEVEWEMIRSHPMSGFEEILEYHQFAEVHPRILSGIFDHHLNFNITGYPSLKRKKKQTLFGRIIALADVYDAMTTPRCYRKRVYSPVDALKLMWRECGAHFDPTLFKVFVNVIGVYPIGSLVQLDDDEMGIVSNINPDPKLLDRPTVLTISKEGDKGRTVNLSEPDEKAGGFKRSIVRCLDPKKYGIHVQEHFL
ncbi:MAG: HD domain-containing protein [Proteobacteria bacterium]|nr:HD domain-containing protein [Pseudomonadota bacterium]